MLSQALDTHMKMGRPNDNEWMHNVLSYLRSFIEHQGNKLLLHEDDKIEYVSQLVASLVEFANNLESGEAKEYNV